MSKLETFINSFPKVRDVDTPFKEQMNSLVMTGGHTSRCVCAEGAGRGGAGGASGTFRLVVSTGDMILCGSGVMFGNGSRSSGD